MGGEGIGCYLKQGILQEELQDGPKTTSTAVAFAGGHRHFLQCLGSGLEIGVGSGEQLLVLLAQRIFGLGQHLLHLLGGQHLQARKQGFRAELYQTQLL